MNTIHEWWHWFWNRPYFWKAETTEQYCERIKRKKDAIPWRVVKIQCTINGTKGSLLLNVMQKDGNLLVRLDDRLDMLVRTKYINFVPWEEVNK